MQAVLKRGGRVLPATDAEDTYAEEAAPVSSRGLGLQAAAADGIAVGSSVDVETASAGGETGEEAEAPAEEELAAKEVDDTRRSCSDDVEKPQLEHLAGEPMPLTLPSELGHGVSQTDYACSRAAVKKRGPDAKDASLGVEDEVVAEFAELPHPMQHASRSPTLAETKALADEQQSRSKAARHGGALTALDEELRQLWQQLD
mmetsp:Transcript_32465/g.75737  ORF Transcript_32465/g.75737 Transcript_32465/m.75737 type:complete len:202 (-) Transcript_32465:632-1237(-)